MIDKQSQILEKRCRSREPVQATGWSTLSEDYKGEADVSSVGLYRDGERWYARIECNDGVAWLEVEPPQARYELAAAAVDRKRPAFAGFAYGEEQDYDETKDYVRGLGLAPLGEALPESGDPPAPKGFFLVSLPESRRGARYFVVEAGSEGEARGAVVERLSAEADEEELGELAVQDLRSVLTDGIWEA